jgi:hypothetical protein
MDEVNRFLDFWQLAVTNDPTLLAGYTDPGDAAKALLQARLLLPLFRATEAQATRDAETWRDELRGSFSRGLTDHLRGVRA